MIGKWSMEYMEYIFLPSRKYILQTMPYIYTPIYANIHQYSKQDQTEQTNPPAESRGYKTLDIYKKPVLILSTPHQLEPGAGAAWPGDASMAGRAARLGVCKFADTNYANLQSVSHGRQTARATIDSGKMNFLIFANEGDFCTTLLAKTMLKNRVFGRKVTDLNTAEIFLGHSTREGYQNACDNKNIITSIRHVISSKNGR